MPIRRRPRRSLAMLGRVAGAFAAIPGVVGYDPLNEPWGDERREIAPLYRDAASALRARHPRAILFLECAGRPPRDSGPGCRTRAWKRRVRAALLQAAGHRAEDGVVRPPSSTGLSGGWRRRRRNGACRSWSARSACRARRRAGEYMDYLYNQVDAAPASAMQWTVSPRRRLRPARGGTARISACSTTAGRPRPNYRPRPYPRRVAGIPLSLRFDRRPRRGGPATGILWAHRPGLGPTEIVVPAGMFPPGSRPRVEPGDATCHGNRRDGS